MQNAAIIRESFAPANPHVQLSFGPTLVQRPNRTPEQEAGNRDFLAAAGRVVFKRTEATLHAVWMAISYYASLGDDRVCFAKIEHIGDKARCSNRTVQRQLARLVERGLLTTDNRKGGHISTRWRVSLPADVAPGVTPCHPRGDIVSPDIRDLRRDLVKRNPDAVATKASPPPNDDRKQHQQPNFQYGQQGRTNTRYEGLIAVCAARSRKLGRPFDEAKTRKRLTVHDLQQLADEIQHQLEIVDADSDTRRTREAEQAIEQAQALEAEQAQARKQAAADRDAAKKEADEKAVADEPQIAQHVAGMREVVRQARKRHRSLTSGRQRPGRKASQVTNAKS